MRIEKCPTQKWSWTMNTKTKSNMRSLDVIAGEIHKYRRIDMFACGDLLIEAREACDHGDWYPWLAENFDWSEDTAERLMRVAQIPQAVRDLRLAIGTFYALTKVD